MVIAQVVLAMNVPLIIIRPQAVMQDLALFLASKTCFCDYPARLCCAWFVVQRSRIGHGIPEHLILVGITLVGATRISFIRHSYSV